MRSGIAISSTGRPFPFDFEAARKFLEDPETFATTLHVILASAYGEALYDPDGDFTDTLVLWTQVRDDFGTWISEEGENRLNALLLALTGEEFFEHPSAFMSICVSLHSGELGGFAHGIVETPEYPAMLWGIFEVSLNRDLAEDEPVELAHFSPAVRKLIVEEAEAEGNEDGEDVSASYADRFVDGLKAELLEQLVRLGVQEDVLSQIRASESTPVHDEEGDVSFRGHLE